MGKTQNSDQNNLVPIGNRGLMLPSTGLVSRGLASLIAPQARIVCFPTDHTVGRLFIRDYDNSRWEKFTSHLVFTGNVVGEDLCWEDAGEALGSIQVPARKELRLDICDWASTNLRFLDTLKPDDLQVIYLWNTHLRDAELIHLQPFTGLKLLSFSNTELTDAALINLQNLIELQVLGLSNTKITDAGLVHIGNLTTLRTLFLRNTKIGDIGLAHIQKLKRLKAIALSDTLISDRGIKYLRNLTSLEEIDLSETNVTEAGLAELRGALPNCRLIFKSMNAIAYCRRGTAFRNKGDLDLAIQDFSQAILLDPTCVAAYERRGDAYGFKRDDFELAFEDSGGDLDRFIQDLKGDLDLAIQDFSQAILLDQKCVAAYEGRGVAYFMKGDFDQAIQDFSHDGEAAHLGRGLVYFKKGDLDGAIEEYNQAILLDPTTALIYRLRAKAYRALGKKDLADTDEKKAQENRLRYSHHTSWLEEKR